MTQRLTCSRAEENKRDCHEISLWSSEKLMSKPLSSDHPLSSYIFRQRALTSFCGTGGGTEGSHLLGKVLPLGYALNPGLGYALNPGLGCLMEAMAL